MDLGQIRSRIRGNIIFFTFVSCFGLACEQSKSTQPKRAVATISNTPNTEEKPATAPVVVEPKTKLVSTSSVCAAGFDEAASHIENQLFPLRIPSCLRALGTACPLLSDAIRRAALKAAAQDSDSRSKTLYETIKRRLSPDCKQVAATDSAEKLGEECYEKRADLSSRLISDMDAGIFAFYLVVEEELKTKKLYDKNSRRILLNLLLTSAMEGEKKKRKKRR